MTSVGQKPIELSWRVFGLGLVAVSIAGFYWGDFVSGQPVPKWIPDRTALAYAAAVFMLAVGVAVQWRRTVTWATAAIVVYYGIIVLLLMNGPVIFKNYTVYAAYFGVAEPLSFIAAATIIYAATADMDATRAAQLTRLARIVFGACAVFYGGAHFFYLNETAPMIPNWLPPNQIFWTYATGVFHVASGIALITGVQARLAAILAAVMYALFIPLVFVPILTTQPGAFRWTELATNIVLIGVAWTIADSLKRR
jgi:uncharacterized membrane protein